MKRCERSSAPLACGSPGPGRRRPIEGEQRDADRENLRLPGRSPPRPRSTREPPKTDGQERNHPLQVAVREVRAALIAGRGTFTALTSTESISGATQSASNATVALFPTESRGRGRRCDSGHAASSRPWSAATRSDAARRARLAVVVGGGTAVLCKRADDVAEQRAQPGHAPRRAAPGAIRALIIGRAPSAGPRKERVPHRLAPLERGVCGGDSRVRTLADGGGELRWPPGEAQPRSARGPRRA